MISALRGAAALLKLWRRRGGGSASRAQRTFGSWRFVAEAFSYQVNQGPLKRYLFYAAFLPRLHRLRA
jgi:hypothetical protein